jgi:NADH:ubiquinone oxidoreductase subunit 2 (subunit N)
VVTAFAYLRVAVLMYMHDSHEPAPPRLSGALSTALAVAAVVTMLGGILPGIITRWATAP